MKNPNRDTVKRLDALPNIGKKMAIHLNDIGINQPQQLVGQDPFDLYDKFCLVSGKKQDPCVIDVFMSVVSFMEGGEALAWWFFTDERKEILDKIGRI